MEIYCCNCKEVVDAKLVDGNSVYPHRPDLYDKSFYICEKCHNFVGCHKDGTPLGTIPSPEIKRYRMQLHSMMDPLWKNKIITRAKLYELISSKLGYRYHNGETRSVDECKKVLSIVKQLKEDLM